MKGFRNFLMRGDVIIVAIGLVIALAFSTLIKAFTDSVINPVVTRAEGNHSVGLGWQLGQSGNASTFLNIGTFVSAIIYFLIFMFVVYFVLVAPYRHVMSRRGKVVFGDPEPTMTCPACLSDDLPAGASKCKHCGTDQPVSAVSDSVTSAPSA